MQRMLLVITALLVHAIPATAQTDSSTFDFDSEAWKTLKLVDGETLDAQWAPDGGNPDGHISGFGFSVRFVAPDSYHGDRSAYYGGTLSFDLKIDSLTGEEGYDSVRLKGGGAASRLTLFQITAPSSAGTWQHFEVPLIAAAGWQRRTPTTESEMQDILANLTSLEIPADFRVSVEDNPIQLDNVKLTMPVPEPSSSALITQTENAITFPAG